MDPQFKRKIYLPFIKYDYNFLPHIEFLHVVGETLSNKKTRKESVKEVTSTITKELEKTNKKIEVRYFVSVIAIDRKDKKIKTRLGAGIYEMNLQDHLYCVEEDYDFTSNKIFVGMQDEQMLLYAGIKKVVKVLQFHIIVPRSCSFLPEKNVFL